MLENIAVETGNEIKIKCDGSFQNEVSSCPGAGWSKNPMRRLQKIFNKKIRRKRRRKPKIASRFFEPAWILDRAHRKIRIFGWFFHQAWKPALFCASLQFSNSSRCQKPDSPSGRKRSRVDFRRSKPASRSGRKNKNLKSTITIGVYTNGTK